MIQQVVRNEYGEPMGIEYVRDQYEEEEAWCEEMQHRAEDPLYAAQQENAYWYQQALACFEEKGIEVPPSVVRSLQIELRNKQRKIEEEKALKEVEPVINYLNEKLPQCEWYANYYPETCDEYGHVEVDCKNRPYTWELAEAIAMASAEGFYEKHDVCLDDYVGESDCKTMVGDTRHDGKWYAKYARNWTAEEYCGQDYIFALRNDWMKREDFTKEEKYLKSIVAITQVKDCYGNSRYDAFRREYPEEKYTIWFGEIRHNGEYNDTICFHWS
jgi:hypothetical protein